MSDKVFTKKLSIISQEELTSFKRANEVSVLYKVRAITETGEKVEVPLRTFHEDLPRGELIEFKVTPYDHPEHGRSYTLSLPSKGRASKKDISEMREQLTKLADRVSGLEEIVQELARKVIKDERLDKKFGEDPPF